MSLQSAVKIEVVSCIIYLQRVHQVILLLESSFLGIYKLVSKPCSSLGSYPQAMAEGEEDPCIVYAKTSRCLSSLSSEHVN